MCLKYIFITIITTGNVIQRKKVKFGYIVAIKFYIYLIVLKINFGLINTLPLRQ